LGHLNETPAMVGFGSAIPDAERIKFAWNITAAGAFSE
jgi:hypothetical protein